MVREFFEFLANLSKVDKEKAAALKLPALERTNTQREIIVPQRL